MAEGSVKSLRGLDIDGSPLVALADPERAAQGAVSVIRLGDGKVSRVDHAQDATQLKTLLGLR